MEIENDFEVIFENGISTLKGHLIDSTEIDFLKDPFSKSRETYRPQNPIMNPASR